MLVATDVFVAKLDASGDLRMGHSRRVERILIIGKGVSVLADGSSIVIWVVRRYRYLRQHQASPVPVVDDVFVAKLDASGNYEWATQAGGTGNDYCTKCVSVLADGSSIVTGYFSRHRYLRQHHAHKCWWHAEMLCSQARCNGNYEWAQGQAGGTSQ